MAFISTTAALRSIVSQPSKRKIGGAWGVHVTSLQNLREASAATLGFVVQGSVRDRIIARATYHLPLSHRWLAAQLGSVSWASAELIGAARFRIGHAHLSTAIDIGGGLLVQEELLASFDEGLDLRRGTPSFEPVVELRLEMSGVGLRVLATKEDLLMGVDFCFPGILGTY